MKNYNDIKTARELLAEVKVHGLQTDVENICRVQDIFGHTPIETLGELANADADNFYFVLFHIWGWREATEFYNNHSNYAYKKLIAENKELSEDNQNLKRYEERCKKAEDIASENAQKIIELSDKAAKQAQEIVNLKAKLYDLISK